MNSLALSLAALLACSAGAQSCGLSGNGGALNAAAAATAGNRDGGAAPTPQPTPADEEPAAGLEVLAVGTNARADQPFVAVVRDTETYAALRELAGELPAVDAGSFKSRAVVAAFLGYRTTGGYSVSITAGPGGVLRVEEVAPPAGAVTAQVITNPFKVVSVEEAEQTPVSLEVGDRWKEWERSYEVAEGDFTASGGIAGRGETFRVRGWIGTSAQGRLRTFRLRLYAEGGSRPRACRATATGLDRSAGGYDIPRLAAGTLVGQPNSGLRATAQFDMKNTVLLFTFEPLPPEVADGFGGRGRLRAQPGRTAPR